MTDETAPALTADEWARHIGFDSWGAFVSGSQFRVEIRGGEIADGQRHALAALCLYEQPFGFTPRDVELLTLLIQEGMPMSAEYARATGLTDEWLLSLRARIRALLPP